MIPPIFNDADVIDSLRSVTGANVVRVQSGTSPNGEPVYRQGYHHSAPVQATTEAGEKERIEAAWITFEDEIGRTIQVPLGRLETFAPATRIISSRETRRTPPAPGGPSASLQQPPASTNPDPGQ